MNFLITKNWAERNAIKKQCVVQKFNRLALGHAQGQAFLLFFHYNGSKVHNWELMKKKIFERGINCKGLFVPSNLHSVILEKGVDRSFVPALSRSRKAEHGLKKGVNVIRDNLSTSASLPLGRAGTKTQKHLSGWRFLMRGPTLIVGCSSTEEMSAIVEICTFPTFYCIGGLYKNNALTHLDIKQWIFLHKLGEKKLSGAFLSLLLDQKKKVFMFYQRFAIHSILHCNLTSLFPLLGSTRANK